MNIPLRPLLPFALLAACGAAQAAPDPAAVPSDPTPPALTATPPTTPAAPASPPAMPSPGMGPGMEPGMGPGSGMGPGRGMGRGMGFMPGFEAFDRDRDGVLTEQEFLEGRAERIRERSQQGYGMRNLANAPTFAELDLNGDGKLTPDEFAAGQARHHRGMMPPPHPYQPSSRADRQRLDHDEVRQLHESDRILSMEEILARARAIQPGQLIEAELENDDGIYLYEIEILAPDGSVHKLELDATTAEVIEHKQKGERKRREP